MKPASIVDRSLAHVDRGGIVARIEKNVPLPTAGTGQVFYPYAKMELHDSFAVKDAEPERGSKSKTVRRLTSSASSFVRRSLRKNPKEKQRRFSVRSRVEAGIRVVRIWRVA